MRISDWSSDVCSSDLMDVTALEALRADLNANRGQRPKLTMLPFLIVAICRTIPDFPMINARYDDAGGVVTRHGAVDPAMATQRDAGLMGPVVGNAQAQKLRRIQSGQTKCRGRVVREGWS